MDDMDIVMTNWKIFVNIGMKGMPLGVGARGHWQRLHGDFRGGNAGLRWMFR